MPRSVNEAAYEARRSAILDVAQRAIATKGYERMAIADLLGELQISSGAFYHYFDSKPALLLAVIERLRDQLMQRALPIIHDPAPGALNKLQRFFNMLDRAKLEHKDFVLSYIHIWYGDENAIVRYKLHIARVELLTPWLEEIIRQGVAEGVFTTLYPDQTARMILALLEDLGDATAWLFLPGEHEPFDLSRLTRIIDACIDGLERLLGAPAGSLQRPSSEELSQWLPPTFGAKEK